MFGRVVCCKIFLVKLTRNVLAAYVLASKPVPCSIHVLVGLQKVILCKIYLKIVQESLARIQMCLGSAVIILND